MVKYGPTCSPDLQMVREVFRLVMKENEFFHIGDKHANLE